VKDAATPAVVHKRLKKLKAGQEIAQPFLMLKTR
jgi:hypothetical protein